MDSENSSMENAYNTTDPKKLLELKRLEADSLLDVLRTINHAELKISQLCMIARNVLRAQLGVKKMVFYYQHENGWVEGTRLGFPPFPPSARDELFSIKTLTRVDGDSHPLLNKYKVEQVIPINNRDETTAYFAIADFADSEIEAENDLIFIETIGNILMVAITNKRLFEEKMNSELVSRELEVAATIQKQLLISDFSIFKDIDVYGMNVAHHGIGGDFYDVIQKDDQITFVCIADVAGKGIAAALLMSNLQANLRALCARFSDLEVIIKELNKILFNITSGEKFVTLFLARINIHSQEVSYINAGHNYPIYIHNNAHSDLDKGCMILGIMPDLEVISASFRYRPGDVLFMYTDGVSEQTNVREEMFGTERILSGLAQYKYGTAKSITENTWHSLKSFSPEAESNDDVTMLSVKFLA
ncbi:MAG: PP2C family protein-serine/threonine phosphatase [Bacteroidota bacterium]